MKKNLKNETYNNKYECLMYCKKKDTNVTLKKETHYYFLLNEIYLHRSMM